MTANNWLDDYEGEEQRLQTAEERRETRRDQDNIRRLIRKQGPRPGHGVAEDEWTGEVPVAMLSRLKEFRALVPTFKFIHVDTCTEWTAKGIDGLLKPWPVIGDKDVRPSDWLAQHLPIWSITWAPGEPKEIRDRVYRANGPIYKAGANSLNTYLPSQTALGNPNDVQPWLEHLNLIYPEAAEEVLRWMAFKTQFPGQKVNHAVVLIGKPGIGKDSLLVPFRHAVGQHNFADIGPHQILENFNPWVQSVVVRINEARDLGDGNRYAFYDRTKALLATPPEMLMVNTKNVAQYHAINCMSVVLTSNYLGALYLPADDRRHFVCNSKVTKEDLPPGHFDRLHAYFENGGIENVNAYLRCMDLSDFNPSAPPRVTAAFLDVVDANTAPELIDLKIVIDYLLEKHPELSVLTLNMLRSEAEIRQLFGIRQFLEDRKTRRLAVHQLAELGWTKVRNPGDSRDGSWRVGSDRAAIVIYGPHDLADADRQAAAADYAKRGGV